MILNIDFWKNLKNKLATRGHFWKKNLVNFFSLKINFKPFRIFRKLYLQKIFPSKNFPEIEFLVYWKGFFYIHGYNTNWKFKMATRGHFSEEKKWVKIFVNIHFRAMEGIIDRGQLSTPGYMSHSDYYTQCKGHVRLFQGKAYFFFLQINICDKY